MTGPIAHGSLTRVTGARSALISTALRSETMTTKAEMVAAWRASRLRLLSAGAFARRPNPDRTVNHPGDRRPRIVSRVSTGLWKTSGKIAGTLFNGVHPDLFPVPRLTGTEIILVTAGICMIGVRDMTGPWRCRRAVRARHIAMYLMREMTTLSFPQIGRLCGDRDHSTVLHGYRSVAYSLAHDPQKYEPQLSAVRRELMGRA